VSYLCAALAAASWATSRSRQPPAPRAAPRDELHPESDRDVPISAASPLEDGARGDPTFAAA
jgi:hypothetical protein